MNRFEKDILESELGLNTLVLNNDALDRKEAEPRDGEETDIDNQTSADGAAETENAFHDLFESVEQLKIDDSLLGSAEEDEKFFVYGYQDELDLSSLVSLEEDGETVDESRQDSERDGSGLYHETVLLMQSGEIDINHGIALLKKNANEGHALSWLYLGQIYSDKKSAIYNPALAFDCYANAASLGHGEGHYNLGICYASGFGCEKNEDMAAECFADGAKEFNPNCICALGICYESGIGCDINYEYAFNLYEKGYELSHPEAANNLGGCYFYGHGVERDTEKAIEIFEHAVTLGSSNAECRLGIIYEEGDGCEPDPDRAIECYKNAAKAKNAVALYRLAVCYDKGTVVDQNFNYAYKCFSRSASLGYDPAKYEAGKRCVTGRGTKKNYDAAYNFLISAAQNGYAPAQYEVANCFFDGLGAMKDRESAYTYYCRAYDSESENRAQAAYRIGLCHLKGLGTEKDEEEAYEWFLTGARLGCAEAAYMLGECYYFGVGTATDAQAAAECFITAAEQVDEGEEDKERSVPLYLALAQCYERGIGTEKDPERAIALYKKAAESGLDEAYFHAGRMIAAGVDIKAEYSSARPYLLRAARRGYVPAMLTMGIFADEGRGVKKNQDDAQSWYLKVVNSEIEPQMSDYDFPERFAESLKLYTESKIKAQYKLGMLVARNGSDISSYAQAFEYVSLSASMGYTPAQYEITRIYACGGDLAEYYESPFFVPDAKFEGGETPQTKNTLGDAMNKLGDTFFDGKSFLKKNEAAAARCYRYAAELGQIDACYSYGWCLRHGVGVHENDIEAAKWLKMAADKGNANAAYSYGLCCEEGSGTGVKNKREAIYYYRLAAGTGHTEAAKRFIALSKGNE